MKWRKPIFWTWSTVDLSSNSNCKESVNIETMMFSFIAAETPYFSKTFSNYPLSFLSESSSASLRRLKGMSFRPISLWLFRRWNSLLTSISLGGSVINGEAGLNSLINVSGANRLVELSLKNYGNLLKRRWMVLIGFINCFTQTALPVAQMN